MNAATIATVITAVSGLVIAVATLIHSIRTRQAINDHTGQGAK